MLRLFQITRDRLVLYIVLCSVKLLHVYNGPQFDVLYNTVVHSTLPCVEVAFGTVPFVEGAAPTATLIQTPAAMKDVSPAG